MLLTQLHIHIQIPFYILHTNINRFILPLTEASRFTSPKTPSNISLSSTSPTNPSLPPFHQIPIPSISPHRKLRMVPSHLELTTLVGLRFSLVVPFCQHHRPTPLSYVAQAERWATEPTSFNHPQSRK